MKIARLTLVLLALTATVATSGPIASSHLSSLYSTGTGSYWFYCYSDLNTRHDCSGTSAHCKQVCESTCNGPCEWDD